MVNSVSNAFKSAIGITMSFSGTTNFGSMDSCPSSHAFLEQTSTEEQHQEVRTM